MATKRTKTNDSENLNDAAYEHVIKMLEQPVEGTKAWTKKECCNYLRIAYNTTRLASLIEKYKENKARESARRAEKRGTQATPAEVSYAVQSYLEGASIESISDALYRGSVFIKSLLLKHDVPMRNTSYDYFKPGLVPDEAMRDSFKVGDKVYSMRYDSLAVIKSEFKPGVYSIYLLSEKWSQYAYQEAAELASLEHLTKLGINV